MKLTKIREISNRRTHTIKLTYYKFADIKTIFLETIFYMFLRLNNEEDIF